MNSSLFPGLQKNLVLTKKYEQIGFIYIPTWVYWLQDLFKLPEEEVGKLKRKGLFTAIIVLTFVAGLLCGLLIDGAWAFNRYSYQTGRSSWRMMGGYGAGSGMMQRYGSGRAAGTTLVSSADTARLNAQALRNAAVDKTANTITYRNSPVTLFLGSGTGRNDGRFVSGSLANPTIHVPAGASVSLQFMNQDPDVAHGILVTGTPPPYPQMAMMSGNIISNSVIAPLPKASIGSYPLTQTDFKLTAPGTYYYLCQYPGHASNGMYGKLIVD